MFHQFPPFSSALQLQLHFGVKLDKGMDPGSTRVLNSVDLSMYVQICQT